MAFWHTSGWVPAVTKSLQGVLKVRTSLLPVLSQNVRSDCWRFSVTRSAFLTTPATITSTVSSRLTVLSKFKNRRLHPDTMVRRLPGYEPVRHSTEGPVSPSTSRFPEFGTEPMMTNGRSSFEVASNSRAPSPTLSTLVAEFDPYAVSPWQEDSPARSRVTSFSEANHESSFTPAGTSPGHGAETGLASIPAAVSERPSHHEYSPAPHGTRSPEPLLNHPPEQVAAFASDGRSPRYEETAQRDEHHKALSVNELYTISLVVGVSFYTVVQVHASHFGPVSTTILLSAAVISMAFYLFIDIGIHDVWARQPKVRWALATVMIFLYITVGWNMVIRQETQLELSQIDIQRLQQKIASLENSTASASLVAPAPLATSSPTPDPAPYVTPSMVAGAMQASAPVNATRPEHAFGFNQSIVVDPYSQVSQSRKLAYSAKFRY